MEIDDVTSERLVSAIRLNRVVLFLGSGFSRTAQNRSHRDMPDGRGLAKALWGYLEYKEPYDGSDLQTVFSAAMNSAKGHKALTSFLEEQLLCTSIPSWYDTLSHIFWYRIYTTNIDDLVEQVFGRSNRVANLDRVVATVDDYRERDQFLYAVQYVKLHGTLPGPLKDITFSWRQYGQRLGTHDPWYDHFVRDYCTRMTVLIGTELNEPWFWQHIESRDRRTPGQSEHRPDAFLVCPTISPAKVVS
jgi:SIR2-like domain